MEWWQILILIFAIWLMAMLTWIVVYGMKNAPAKKNDEAITIHSIKPSVGFEHQGYNPQVFNTGDAGDSGTN